MFKKLPIFVAMLLVVIIGFMMCAFQVRFTETAVVTRFDEIRDVIKPDGAGLHFKLPWPIDHVYRYDTRLRSFETEFRQAATKDQKTVILTAYATWRISDGQKFLKAVGQEDTAAPKIRDLLENQVQLVLRRHDLRELVNTDEKKLKLDEIEDMIMSGIEGANVPSSEGSARTGIQDPAQDRYGIEIVSVGIKRLGLPETVTKDVFNRMKEDREKVIKELKTEGEAEATTIRAEAEENSTKIIARAKAYAKTLVGQAEAEAARYNEIFSQDRELSTFLLKQEAMEKILESGQITIVLDSDKIPPFDLLEQTGKETDHRSDAAVRSDEEVRSASMARRPEVDEEEE